jgi:hypothetical protein
MSHAITVGDIVHLLGACALIAVLGTLILILKTRTER